MSSSRPLFFFTATATTEIYTLSLHDALPISDWYAKTSPSYSGIVSRPGVLFAFKFQPPKQQQMLVTLSSAHDLKSEKEIGRAHVRTPVTDVSRMPSSAYKKKKNTKMTQVHAK